MDIQDWPSLPYRGLMMDLSHGPMPTEVEIRRQIDFLSRWKGMREDYRLAWDAEYAPYRKQTALSRWDAEYEYWHRLQARFWELRRGFKDHDPLPLLQSFRPGHSPASLGC